MSEPMLISVEQAAEILSLSRSTVQRLMSSGHLASVKIGGSRRIPADAITEYVAQLTQPTA